MAFINDAILRVDPHSGLWVLDEPLLYESKAGEFVWIPSGFITDLASIPQIFHSIVPVNGKHRDASILHDYLFVVQSRPRSEVDALFLEAMESRGVRFTQRWAMYLAVRAGGWLPWRKNERDRQADLKGFLARYGLK